MDAKLIMLHTHWVAADAIYATRRAPISGEDKAIDLYGADAVAAARMVSSFYRMLIFYALVYVVVEAYRDFGDQSLELDRIIDEGPTDELRRLRNAVFHVQNEPFSPKIWNFLLTPDSEKWIHRLHRGFEPFFRERMPVEDALAALRDQFSDSAYGEKGDG